MLAFRQKKKIKIISQIRNQKSINFRYFLLNLQIFITHKQSQTSNHCDVDHENAIFIDIITIFLQQISFVHL